MKTIYLTFDDGPSMHDKRMFDGEERGVTEQVLKVLEDYNIKATFFCVGSVDTFDGTGVDKRPKLLDKIAMAGHLIGNHTYTHPNNLSTLTDDAIKNELMNASDAIYKRVGFYPRHFRAPLGDDRGNVNTIARSLGLSDHIGWGADTEDWHSDEEMGGREKAENSIRDKIKGAGDGDIVLCHDKFAHTPAALKKAFKDLSEDKDNCFKTMAGYPSCVKADPIYQYHIDYRDRGYKSFYYSAKLNDAPGPNWVMDGMVFSGVNEDTEAKGVRQYHHQDSSRPLRYAYTIKPYTDDYGPGWIDDNKPAFYAFNDPKADTIPLYLYYHLIEDKYWNLFYSTYPDVKGPWIKQGQIFYVYR
jgi:peptidoglycan/xylan/chitin deacetylase (PgdA/CDA1 family)